MADRKSDPSSADLSDGAYTIEEFCKQYGIGRTSFYDEVNQGRLLAKKRGSRTLIPREEARRWFENLPSLTVRGEALNAA